MRIFAQDSDGNRAHWNNFQRVVVISIANIIPNCFVTQCCSRANKLDRLWLLQIALQQLSRLSLIFKYIESRFEWNARAVKNTINNRTILNKKIIPREVAKWYGDIIGHELKVLIIEGRNQLSYIAQVLQQASI